MKKVIATTLAAGAVAAAVTLAPTASASELGFVQDLNSNGISIYDANQAVNSGYTICNMLNTTNGEQVVEWVYLNSSFSDVPSRYWAYIWTESAVENLCPWHDHRGSIYA